MELIMLLDGNNLMHRAFHALPLLTNDSGVYTNALHGFLAMLLKAVSEYKPQYCIVAFDEHGGTFRHEQYAEYKAGRAPMPEELRPQLETIRALLTAMNVCVKGLPGYEADDLLGTFSKQAEEQGLSAMVVSGDKDALQLVSDATHVLYLRQGISDTIEYTPAAIQERYGFEPVRIIDMKGLMGDSSDNIPGIPGVGEKTALKLLHEFGSLESALDNFDKQKGKLREKLIEYREQAIFSKQLATIDRDAPVKLELTEARLGDMSAGAEMLNELGLHSILRRLSGEGVQAASAAKPQVDEPVPPITEIADISAWTQAVSAAGESAAVYIGDELSLASNGKQYAVAIQRDLLSPQVDETEMLAALPSDGQYITHDSKTQYRKGVHTECRFDTMLGAYLLDSSRKSFSLDALREDGKLTSRADGLTDAAAISRLAKTQQSDIERQGTKSLYYDIELPLARVLREMEDVGFLVDTNELARLGEGYQSEIKSISQHIYELAGEEFNIQSTKQLADILYVKLGLESGRKTQRGFSTDAETLERLADENEIAAEVLKYRKYAKLQGTYIEGLLRLVGADGRIHTSFDQTATATGRISSLEPNLQNIPVRTELGRDIRRAFIAAPGHVLVDADYSQIELRVLAHMADEQGMLAAFRSGQDIHASTASEVFDVDINDVTPQMRSAAKAVNFGIVYGISDFGLARNLGIARTKAHDYIERYKERYPGIKRYMDRQVALGKSQGYVTTLMGRRRYLPQLASPNYNIRSFGERAAMNSPIQGTAADIIKLAMVRVQSALRASGLAARLILQVHDELIIEAPPAEVERVKRLMQAEMEQALTLQQSAMDSASAAPAVPLRVDISIGENWNECK